MIARGRDLRTGSDGTSTVLGTGGVDAMIDFINGRRITAIAVEPSGDRVDALIGVSVGAGFRQAVDDALPGERATASIRYQLLDDMPTVTLVGGYAIGAGGIRRPRHMPLANENLCAGWMTGGTIMLGLAENGVPPLVTGPDAPSLLDGDDREAWHAVPALPPHSMRRWRRIDAWREEDHLRCECFFRDSHVDGDGRETVVHEYTVEASLDREGRRFTACEATIGALPWLECPSAASSAERLVGAPAAGLRTWVRETFVGPPTCTHLNDTLRALEDVPALVAALPT